MINYKIEADLDLINEMIDPILSSLKEKNVENKVIYQVNLILEEIFVNIAKYAYTNKNGMIDISYEIDDNFLKVTIKDNGKEFNPLEREEPDLTSSIQDRKIGGLGIYIIKKMVYDIKYNRIGGTNVLEFTKNI